MSGAGMARAAVALVAAGLCGCSIGSTASPPDIQLGSREICEHTRAWGDALEEITAQEGIPDELSETFPTLAAGFTDDAERLEEDGDASTALALRAAARTLELLIDDIEALQAGDVAPDFGEHLAGVSKALATARPGFCGPPDGRRWVADDRASVEVRVPEEWESTTVNWDLPRDLADLRGVVASPNPVRWLNNAPVTVVPGIFVARSDSLASRLKLSDRRFAAVLDRLQEVLKVQLDRSRSCDGGDIAEFAEATQQGFLRVWRDCDGRDVAIIEVVQARPLPGGEVTLLYFLATAYAPGDVQPIVDALATFHVVTDQP
jgi:hypothetical protein